MDGRGGEADFSTALRFARNDEVLELKNWEMRFGSGKRSVLASGSGGEFGEDGLEGCVFEEADFDADGDDLAEVGGGGEVFAAGAEMGEAEVAGAGEFEAGGDDGGVEIDDRTELDFDTELHGGGGESLAVGDPASAVGEGGGEGGKEALALFVAEALDVERLHKCRASAARLIAARVFIGEWGLSVRSGGGYRSHVTGSVWCCN
jgi:hypothetical protein